MDADVQSLYIIQSSTTRQPMPSGRSLQTHLPMLVLDIYRGNYRE